MLSEGQCAGNLSQIPLYIDLAQVTPRDIERGNRPQLIHLRAGWRGLSRQ